MAKSQLRWNRALDSGVENLDDWKDALNNLSTSELLSSDYLDDIADAYADMLDIDASTIDIDNLIDPTNL
jgi:hypothetical protein